MSGFVRWSSFVLLFFVGAIGIFSVWVGELTTDMIRFLLSVAIGLATIGAMRLVSTGPRPDKAAQDDAR